MKCPHCLVDFHDDATTVELVWREAVLRERDNTRWCVRTRVCPACGRAIISLTEQKWLTTSTRGYYGPETQRLVWPRGVARAPLPAEVKDPYAKDYREACNTLAESANASAALSRRCLQRVLREKAGVKEGKLYAEIDEVIKAGTLPSYITESLLDAVRHFGNFAAHPERDVNTGEIIDVEPGEAEWCLDILEMLFDFYFVQPAKAAERAARLQEKLKNAGKKS